MRKRYTYIDPAERARNICKLLVAPVYQSLKDIFTKGNRDQNSKPDQTPAAGEEEVTWSSLMAAPAESAIAADRSGIQPQAGEQSFDLSATAETREKLLTLMEAGNWSEAERMAWACLKGFGAYAHELLEAQSYREEDYFCMFLTAYSKFAYLYAFGLHQQQNPLAAKVALFAPYIQTNPSRELIEACQAITSFHYHKELPAMSLTVAECFQETVKIALETGVLPR